MLNDKTIGLVISAYNEEKQIEKVISTVPEFVDVMIVVNDGSKDTTAEIVKNFIDKDSRKPILPKTSESLLPDDGYHRAEIVARKLKESEFNKERVEIINPDLKEGRIVLINHLENRGKGAAVSTGYLWCRANRIDCVATIDGDGQMDITELKKLCMPVVLGEVDYVKSNRLSHRSALFVIPKLRYFGNSVLSLLTKIASGYWRISDSQSGYNVISLEALNALRLNRIYPKYGYLNDVLVKLNIAYFKIKELPIKPVYNVGEQSKMKIGKVTIRLSFFINKTIFLKVIC